MLKLSGGKLVFSLGVRNIDLYLDEGKCSFEEKKHQDYKFVDCEGLYVLPGFVDQHIHGAKSIDFSNCTIDQLSEISLLLASRGVTSFVPTLTTLNHENTLKALKIISENADLLPGARIAGIHMEGPYLNPVYAGAQNVGAMRSASISEIEEYIKASEEKLSLITLSPEIINDNDFLRFLKDKKIKVNIGHSGATFKQCNEALLAGAGCVTHFLNGMREFHQHEPSIFGASVLASNFIEIICDGYHLVPDTIRVVKQIFGSDRIILVSDSIPAAGLGDGEYQFDCFAEDVVIVNGDAQLKDSKVRAGSTLFMDTAFKNFIKYTECSLSECVQCTSLNSLKYLGLDNKKGELSEGNDADIVILDADFNVVYTIVNGIIVYSKKE
ncbi:MAG: N-acetylglucosamine-6-phosphate deacetylase [Saccharofermentanales bacterium]|jgi:N-acetylglucosamine-6-phosphate deacetylase